MLSELTVKNLALIDLLVLSFGEGANILTGETGAGKSILVGALGLLTGRRGGAELVRAGAEEAEVTAVIHLDYPEELAPVLETLGLEFSEEIILRRVLSSAGRGRAYINERPVPQAHLSTLGQELLSICSQHDQQSLLKVNSQLEYLDRFGHHRDLLDHMNEVWGNLSRAASNLKQFEKQLQGAADKRDLYEFQLAEIKKVEPHLGEDNKLFEEKNRAKNSGRLLESLCASSSILGTESGNVVEKLGRVRKHLEKAAELDSSLAEKLSIVEESYHQLADLAVEFDKKRRDLGVDPNHLEWIDERLNTLAKLKRKYNLSLTDIIERAVWLQQTLDQLDGAGLDLSKLRREHAQAREVALEVAKKLHQARLESAKRLSGTLAKALKPLGFPRLEMEVRVTVPQTTALQNTEDSPKKEPDPGPSGYDKVEFLFSPNPGEGLKPLAKIASGGELSRVMLALMTLLDRPGDQLLVFDEIDTGLGGATAEAVAGTMAELAGRQQVVVITHLPQMAALAGRHFLVAKNPVEDGTRTVTSLTALSSAQRVEELARMLGGASPSPEALALAHKLLAC